ncbi:hypothetical protein J4526_03910 [Desulfurococcaceae archaeon MEX13E-LK6-19]|nr:hypothetical protein J4526_03910 [Desulfurococcaceae archaeon MEX13E-LK6-19]
MASKSFPKIMFLLIETTSLPLLVLAILMIISGYALVYPHVISGLTFGAMNYSTAHRIHTDPLIRSSFAILALLHSLAGTFLLIEKHVKNKTLKSTLEFIAMTMLLYLLLIIIMAELFA